MKQKITQNVDIPQGVKCEYSNQYLICTKDSLSSQRKIVIPKVDILIKDNKIILDCIKGNKKTYKIIMSNIAHIKNLFKGLNEPFSYELESCNVHFPMTMKVESDQLVINNFLGEKTPRKAKILPEVKVDIKGQKIIVSSHNREAAGQTAANFEKATRVTGRDRRIYQDGIFITKKPGRSL